jgi:hypothetical protein
VVLLVQLLEPKYPLLNYLKQLLHSTHWLV